METPNVNYTINFTVNYSIGKTEYSSVRYLPQYEAPVIRFYPEVLPFDRAEEHRVA